MNKNIIVCGDLHGRWDQLNNLVNKKKPELLLQAGDFGWWPGVIEKPYVESGMRYRGFDPNGQKVGDTKVIFAPGNHENYNELDKHKGYLPEVAPNIFYAKRRTLYTLPDGRVVLFIGGAMSIDKNSRMEGVSWFPQEMIPMSDYYYLKEANIPKVDIVISHTCPHEFKSEMEELGPNEGWGGKFRDASQDVLSGILHLFEPDLWYFGHFHVHKESYYKPTNTKWFALDMAPNPLWWRYLEN